LTLGPRYANIGYTKDKIMTKVFDATKFRKSITKSIQGLGIGFSDPTDWIINRKLRIELFDDG